MALRTFAATALVLVLASCASAGSGGVDSGAHRDRTLAERAAEVTAPIGIPPASSTAEVAQEAANDPPPDAGPNTIRVPGQNEPTPLPPGDPRTGTERMRDIRAWDRCVLRAQAAISEPQPGELQESPEEVCRRALGMRDRLSVPVRD
jgi:hypothetical protein